MTSIVDILTTFYNAIKTKFATKEDVKQPDYIQNDSAAADYIKNRPFYSEPTNINITWDGNTTGLTASSKNHYYKVSDLVFTLEQFEAMTFTDNSGSEYLIGSGFIINGNNVLSYGDMGPVIATIDNAGGIPGGWSDIFPEAGVYFPASGWVVSLKGTAENIVKLDNKFLDLSDYSTKTDLSDKMDKSNPTGTGSFSLNRKSDTTVGDYSFAEGYNNEASGNYSHAEGFETTASSDYSHAEGMGTKAASFNQHVQGTYNIVDAAYADIIGNGAGDAYRSNAATVDWSGNTWYAGDVYVGSTSGTNKDEGSKKLATEEYVDSKQVQHDYNQNDSTAADYIKNRPFYTGDSVETMLVEESTVTFANANGTIYMGQIQSNFEATVGELFKVYWDGTTYESPCVNFSESLFIGNLSITGVGSDTGEPFLMYVINGMGIEIYTLDTSASHTFSISGFISEVIQIPDKYISDTFRDVVIAGNPLNWSEDNWTKYYNLFKNGKLLKINNIASSNGEGYILSMFYSTGIYNMSVIDSTGDLYKLGINQKNEKNEFYWAPIIYGNEFYFRYIKTGSNTDSVKSEEYQRLELSDGLKFTTKNANEGAVKQKVMLEGDKEIILSSSTSGSAKKFKITVDDSGTISATEVS